MFLDPEIRNWVLFPIMGVMVLVGILRNNVTMLLTTAPKSTLKQIRENQALIRVRTLRSPSSSILSPGSFSARRDFMVAAFERKDYLANPNATGPANPMSDPAGMEQMMEGMKKNFAMIIPQTVIMSWVTFFFSGFVLIQLPFPLTLRFKAMLQNGIATQDMDVTWVSSLSWYFLNLFGLKSIFTMILGDENSADGMRDMQQMQAMGAPQMGQANDSAKIFQSEKEFLEISLHEFALNGVEAKLLKKWRESQK